MKTIIAAITFFFAFIIESSAQSPEALKSMRIGKFTYQGEEGKVEIIRTASEQTEIYNDGKSKGVLDISWLSDTEYVLTLKASENASGCIKTGDIIRTKILNCEGNKYYYESSSVTCGQDSNTIIKVE